MVSDPSLHDDPGFDWGPDWEDEDTSPGIGNDPSLPVTLTDGLIPLDRNGQ